MTKEEQAAHNAYMDMIVPEEHRAEFEKGQADRFEAWKQEQQEQKKINEMFGIGTDDEVRMDDGDFDVNQLSNQMEDQVQFTDDETAERIPGLDQLM